MTPDTKWGNRLPPPKAIKPFDKLKAVRNCICIVINKEILKRKHDRLMKEFPAVFEPIPHFDKLPNDVQAEIKLIDPTKKSKQETILVLVNIKRPGTLLFNNT